MRAAIVPWAACATATHAPLSRAAMPKPRCLGCKPPAAATSAARSTPLPVPRRASARALVVACATRLRPRELARCAGPLRRLPCDRAIPGRPALRRDRRVASAAWPGLLVDAPVAAVCAAAAALFAATCALVLGKGNIVDGMRRLLALVGRDDARPETKGEAIPVVQTGPSALTSKGPVFNPLFTWFMENGSVYKLQIGPKAFIVVSDPVVARHLLRDNSMNYSKGVLAEILEPIMGNGLIPADGETSKVRRKAIAPAFHMQYYAAMAKVFGACTERVVDKIEAQLTKSDAAALDMELEFSSLSLDIIGLGVFNYEFGAINCGSPVIKAVYGVLLEAEHRATFYLPYWNIPLAKYVVPRQVKFNQDLKTLNNCLDDLIRNALEARHEDDMEALQARDYATVRDPSLLRFLVDMRGEDTSNKQLRDDLMTLLIAGHETVAALLTWAFFCIVQNPRVEQKLLDEVDSVVGDRVPTVADIRAMPYLRATLAESLRLYPQPPVLMRRAIRDDTLPAGMGASQSGYPIGEGSDLFISVWNLHHSPHLWRDPEAFTPERFEVPFTNEAFGGAWAGYNPASSALYPNEVSSDFAFLPFGGGSRKCLGDQFAMFEATIAAAMLLRRYTFRLAGNASDVGMAVGATIHTTNGLHMRITRRQLGAAAAAVGASEVAQV